MQTRVFKGDPYISQNSPEVYQQSTEFLPQSRKNIYEISELGRQDPFFVSKPWAASKAASRAARASLRGLLPWVIPRAPLGLRGECGREGFREIIGFASTEWP